MPVRSRHLQILVLSHSRSSATLSLKPAPTEINGPAFGTAHAQNSAISHRTRQWSQRPNMAKRTYNEEREAFFKRETARGDELKKYFSALDTGDGEMLALADSVRTAADYKAETPFPCHGLPEFGSRAL